MSQEQSKVQPDVQAGSSRETAGVAPAVGGVHSSEDWSWLDLRGVSPEMRAWLKAQRRDSARSASVSAGQRTGRWFRPSGNNNS
jgi:hypothetical protein